MSASVVVRQVGAAAGVDKLCTFYFFTFKFYFLSASRSFLYTFTFSLFSFTFYQPRAHFLYTFTFSLLSFTFY